MQSFPCFPRLRILSLLGFIAALTAVSAPRLRAQPATASVTILHSFDGLDGEAPREPFLKASDGNYYAPVAQGGDGSNGTIIKVTPEGVFSVLHTFVNNFSTIQEGSLPKAITQGPDGALYGVCRGGGSGANASAGTFFKLALDGTFTKVYDFDVSTDGTSPSFPSAFVAATDGNFYGL